MGAASSSDSFRELRSEVHGHPSAFEERGYGLRRLETKSTPDLEPIKKRPPDLDRSGRFVLDHLLQTSNNALPRRIPPDPLQLFG